MIVKLAGFNVDLENIRILENILSKYPDISSEDIGLLKQMHWTPETISASYARISRDPRSIDELRKDARNEIEKARKSNNSIIYEMGHSSIAEHGIFNIDIIGISRLLSEELEKSRLVSFTEKSQRYIKIGEDNHSPEEFKKDESFYTRYLELTNELFETYNLFLEKLEKYFTGKYPVENVKSSKYRDVINLAKEDARYILPLSTQTQLGMTINSRNLEGILRKLSAIGTAEAKALSSAIYEEVRRYAPSLVKYTKPSEFLLKTYAELNDVISATCGVINMPDNDVELCSFDQEAENRIIAGFILRSAGCGYAGALDAAQKLSMEDKKRVLSTAVKRLMSYEPLPREFELAEFELGIRLSATAFAQLKRHRMITLIDGGYLPANGITVPPSIVENGLDGIFMEKIGKINSLYDEAAGKFGKAADYILSNAHKKNILIKCNFRELAHITRLRSDSHAQWDIRAISDLIADEVEKKLPLLAKLLCGKEEITGRISRFFNI